ncbi:hypothetical protein GCM10020221_25260 [Streptomyces thioluteus]|uniref:UDP-glucose/GDP-mannose dehydrogenase N-terminal domain-containing protein n=1 Tax=Streptomyces thioluteus TaxID=66431 RepID=A0ABN3WUC9_STRTU
MAPKITVIGTGYLGATHAAAMAELGFEVLGLDVVPEKIEMLSRAEVPMYEPGLEELLGKHVAGLAGSSGRLRFTTSWEEVASSATSTSSVSTPRRSTASTRATCRTSTPPSPRSRRCCTAPRWSSASPPCRWASAPGWRA